MKVEKHVCQECSKSFARATILRDHLRAHQGKRPFECEWDNCDRAFTRSWDLKSHLQTHIQSAPHRCRGCGVRFQRKRDVSRHQRRKNGSRCRTVQVPPTRSDEEAEAAGTLAELKNDDLERHGKAAERRSKQSMEQQQQTQHNSQPVSYPLRLGMAATIGAAESTSPAALLEQYPALRSIDWYHAPSGRYTYEGLPQAQPEQLPCPLKAKWDRWVGDAYSPAHLPPWRQQCQSSTGSDILDLRIHLRSDHNVHALCAECNERLRARATYRWYSERSRPCQNRNPWAPCGLKGVSAEPIILRQFLQLDLPSIEPHEPTLSEWFAIPGTLPNQVLVLLHQNVLARLNGSNVTTSQVSKFPESIPYEWFAAYDGSQESIRSWYQPTSGVAPVSASVDESASTAHAPPLPDTIASDGQYRTIASLNSSPPEIPASQGRIGSPSDGIPDPGPDLLKVIVDVTKYLGGMSPQEAHFRMSFCQWTILERLVARLDEVPKADPSVTSIHTDALWREFDKHRYASRRLGPETFDKAFDQIMRPSLSWRRSEPMARAALEWVADFKSSMKLGCRREICPCERYLEMLHPRGDCVTALSNYKSSAGLLSYVARDKLRLISRHGENVWGGQCIRTGQTGEFLAFACA